MVEAAVLPTLAIVLLVLPFAASHARSDPARSEHAKSDAASAAAWREVWSGADVSSHAWLVYSGITIAPKGTVHGDGVRLRAAGGYGGYRYADKVPTRDNPQTFAATTYFADLLVGYQMRIGPLTAKAFAGATTISHDIAPFDDQTIAAGDETGAKAVVELWLNMGHRAWGSLDMAWSSAHETRSARLRTGYRIWPTISVGLEAAVNVDGQADCRMATGQATNCRHNFERLGEAHQADLLDYARLGAFLRQEWQGGEISLGAGALGGSMTRQGSELDPYLTVNWIKQF